MKLRVVIDIIHLYTYMHTFRYTRIDTQMYSQISHVDSLTYGEKACSFGPQHSQIPAKSGAKLQHTQTHS